MGEFYSSLLLDHMAREKQEGFFKIRNFPITDFLNLLLMWLFLGVNVSPSSITIAFPPSSPIRELFRNSPDGVSPPFEISYYQ